jgi:hypothetical protein
MNSSIRQVPHRFSGTPTLRCGPNLKAGVHNLNSIASSGLHERSRLARPPTQDVKMKLHTIFELANRSDNELLVIYRDVFNKLAQSDEGSAGRRNALATIENVNRVIRSRIPRP